VNYNNTVAEVFIEAAKLVLRTSDDLRLLALCDLSDGHVEKRLGLYNSQTEGLSSWVPYWVDRRAYTWMSKHISDQILKGGISVLYMATRNLLYHPSGEDGFPDEKDIIRSYGLTANHTDLKVKGAIFSLIRSLGPLYDSNEEGHLNIVPPYSIPLSLSERLGSR
jgi:hypothetical protein